jgi:allantoin racemase
VHASCIGRAGRPVASGPARPMPDILLINPNTSAAATSMMVGVAAATMPAEFRVTGIEAARGAAMITNEAEMAFAARQVQRSWLRAGPHWSGAIVSAFGDPGLERLRGMAGIPVVGICEASIVEAAQGGRRFGIATVTPALETLIRGCVDKLGLGHAFRGLRLTAGDPRALAAQPRALADALAAAIGQCVDLDGADVVIIGGGPLAQAAAQLQQRLAVPLVAPIPAAARQLARLLAGAR